jgi:chromosome segregation ATPase
MNDSSFLSTRTLFLSRKKPNFLEVTILLIHSLLSSLSYHLSEIEETLGELELRTEAVTKLSSQLGILSQEIQTNRQKLTQAEKDREDAANAMLKCKDQLHQIEIEYNDCKEQLSVWEERCLNAENKISNLEQETQHLTHQLEEDGLNTMRKFKLCEDRIKELQLQLLQKTQDLETAQEVARKLRREYQSTRQDAEGMLQVMSGLERQLAEYSSRESEIERIAVESKEKLEEAYVARDQVSRLSINVSEDLTHFVGNYQRGATEERCREISRR